MLDMLKRLEPVVTMLQAEIDTLRLTDRGSWSLALDTGADIELGRGTPEEVVTRLQRFVRTLDLIGCNCTIEKEMPELGVTIPISGPGMVPMQPGAQNDVFDSRSPHDKGVSWQPCWVFRVWDKVAKRRQY